MSVVAIFTDKMVQALSNRIGNFQALGHSYAATLDQPSDKNPKPSPKKKASPGNWEAFWLQLLQEVSLQHPIVLILDLWML